MGLFKSDETPEEAARKAAEKKARKEARDRQREENAQRREVQRAERAERQAELDRQEREARDKRLASSSKNSEKSAKRDGIDVEGAIFVSMRPKVDTKYDQYLLVYPTRVEFVHKRKDWRAFTDANKRESIPFDKVSSVECHKDGLTWKVTVHTSNNSIEHNDFKEEAEHIRRLIQDGPQVERDLPSAFASSGVDPAEQLKKLAELHAAGILTDDEFAAKKADLLGRI